MNRRQLRTAQFQEKAALGSVPHSTVGWEGLSNDFDKS